MASGDKPLIWLEGEIKLLRFPRRRGWKRVIYFDGCNRLKRWGCLIPGALPSIGARCHELRINDERTAWRIIYRTDSDAIIILDVFNKKSRATPKAIIDACRKRLKDYDNA